MEEKIKIGCPKCGMLLSVRNQVGLESMSITCPICKKRSPFASFRRITDSNEEEHTQLPDEYISSNYTLGRIVLVSSDTPFQLQIGKNIIGRKATGSKAHVQIPCENKRMSREHLVIEVKNEHGKGLVHYLSLNKQQVNPTYVGGVLLEFGDKIVLNHNDIIRLPDVEVRFEIPDEEGTELNT